MGDGLESLPDDIETLKAVFDRCSRGGCGPPALGTPMTRALIAHLKLQIEKLNRDRYGRARSVPRGYWISSN